MISKIWANCGLFFEEECDAVHYGLGKGDWGDNSKPYPTYIIYDPETEEYYQLVDIKPITFHCLDEASIKEQALAKLTQKEKEVLGL